MKNFIIEDYFDLREGFSWDVVGFVGKKLESIVVLRHDFLEALEAIGEIDGFNEDHVLWTYTDPFAEYGSYEEITVERDINSFIFWINPEVLSEGLEKAAFQKLQKQAA